MPVKVAYFWIGVLARILKYRDSLCTCIHCATCVTKYKHLILFSKFFYRSWTSMKFILAKNCSYLFWFENGVTCILIKILSTFLSTFYIPPSSSEWWYCCHIYCWKLLLLYFKNCSYFIAFWSKIVCIILKICIFFFMHRISRPIRRTVIFLLKILGKKWWMYFNFCNLL